MRQSDRPITEEPVLVTGASGFIASHIVKQLLERGYRVRGTVRSESSAAQLRETLHGAGVEGLERLEIAYLTLDSDEGWDDAMRGVEYVMHTASPFPKGLPKHEDELIIPAREGALRALGAAARAGVKRVVLTSSLASVAFGHDEAPEVWDETMWSNPDGNILPYEKSKTLAERAAWDFVGALPSEERFELVAINPGVVLGPALSARTGTSLEIVRRLLAREMPGLPQVALSIADVRDVADLHIAAMEIPEAAGERFICGGPNAWFGDIARILKDAGYRVPTLVLPNFVVRLYGFVDESAALIRDVLGKPFNVSDAKARRVFDYTPRTLKETVLDSAASLKAHGVS